MEATKSKGLGMKIVLSLVQQIAGALRITSGADGRGASFVVTFGVPRLGIV